MSIERLKCYDCGCHLKRKKAIERSVMDELGNNVFRIFCSSCAKKRGLSKINENKTIKILKSVVRLAIVIIPVIFWRWFENDTRGWGGGILTVGALVIIFLFMLYDGLK
ncbi:MAG: hypothetical protein PHC54_01955 [Candidatus Omnitrophica bacterium]|nr:hypothetical protein [Candidatus Omnitrophota bacterium]MDD5592061.1 hypothetical protein [Candidatus Omnitrophota bacterium]